MSITYLIFQLVQLTRLLASLFLHYQLPIINCQLFCGEYRSRTDDLLLAKQAL
jgi:hypothetical protein